MQQPVTKYAALLLALAIVSCDKPQGATPQAPAGDVAREVVAILAPNAQIVDLPFEDAIARLDLAKMFGARAGAIADQIHKTRAAVAAARASSSVSHGRRLASVMGVVGTFSIPQFASTFAFSLDDLTKKNSTITMPGNPYSSTATDDISFTTTTLSTTEIFSGTGSVVTGTFKWSATTITIDSKTGATLLHLTDDREIVGTINVCPEGGVAPATLAMTSKFVMQGPGTTTTRKSNGNSAFKGKVTGQAALGSVTQDQHSEASWQSTTGNGGYKADNNATWNAGGNGYLGGLQTGSFTGKLSANGSATAAEAAKAAGWDVALDAYALEAAFQKAQELWRKGRCVIVTVPEYSAETPIETFDQQKSQHTKDVDVASDTKFGFQLKHRFGGAAVNATTNAVLTSGKEKIEPGSTQGSGGQLTYKADAEDDKEAKVQLQATSDRGIGTLVLTFRTGGKLTLSVQGTQELGSAGATLRSTVSIGPAVFEKKDEKTWEATAPFTATSVLVPPDKDCPNLKITQSGTLVLTATVEKRGEQSFWVIRNGGGGSSKAVGSGCDEDVTKSVAVGGGFGAGLFLGNVGDIVVPIDGGTVPLSGSQGTGRSSGTATATVKKK